MELRPLLLLFFLLGLVLSFAALLCTETPAGRRAGRILLCVEALFLAVATPALIAYVAAEDDYRDNGISRWDAYDAHVLTIAAVALGAAAIVAVAFVLARQRSARGARFVGLLALAAWVAQIAAYIANTAN